VRYLKLILVVAVVAIGGMGRAARAEVSEAKNAVRVALMHGVPEKWNLDRNFATFLKLSEAAAAEHADILITPECWLDGYAAPDKASTPDRLRAVAQDLGDSPYLMRVAEEAKKRNLYICFGFTSLERGGVFNSAGLWSSAGKLVGVYHKTHLQMHDLQFKGGEALPVWPTPWGPIGMMICADRRWPETARTLRLQGARLILNPTYGFTGDLNEAMMRTRSFENQCFIAFAHPKTSLVTDPGGKVLGKKETEAPGIMVCDLDLNNAKDDIHLRDRRPDLYDIITKK
jgi:predicted amidohydrolase